jgi:hypothetical protein
MAHSWFTEHARARMQQRGISPAAIEILLSYGRSSHDHRGCEVVYFDKPARERLAKHNPAAAREAERFSRAYAVLGSNGVVVTVGHRYRRLKRR